MRDQQHKRKAKARGLAQSVTDAQLRKVLAARPRLQGLDRMSEAEQKLAQHEWVAEWDGWAYDATKHNAWTHRQWWTKQKLLHAALVEEARKRGLTSALQTKSSLQGVQPDGDRLRREYEKFMNELHGAGLQHKYARECVAAAPRDVRT